MTVDRLIQLAFFDLGAIQSGESPSTDEKADALDLLRGLVGSWSGEDVVCYNRRHYTFSATVGLGASAFTIGPGGTWSTTARPVKVEGGTAYYLNWRQPLEVVSLAEFGLRSAAPKGHTQPLPELLGVDNSYPALSALLFPVSSLGCSVQLHTLEPLTNFTSLADTLDFPDVGYERALRLNLAVELAPQYSRQGGIDQVLLANAAAAKAQLAMLNASFILPAAQPQQ
jgi:hypothetical protein